MRGPTSGYTGMSRITALSLHAGLALTAACAAPVSEPFADAAIGLDSGERAPDAGTGDAERRMEDAHEDAGPSSALEVLVIPSDGTVVASSTYASTSAYVIEGSGVYKWGSCDTALCPGGSACGHDRFGDAMCRTDDCWQTHTDAWSTITLWIDGAQVDWGPCHDQHVYALERPGNNGPFLFNINDCASCYGDNDGELKVRIWNAAEYPGK